MKLEASLKIFSLLFGVIYMLCFYYSLVPFRYYPMLGSFHLDEQPEAAGPPILWYGWLAAAAVIAAAISVLVPSQWANRLWHGWLWTIPALTVVAILLYERRWFL